MWGLLGDGVPCGGRGETGSPIIRLCLRLALSLTLTLSPRSAAITDALLRTVVGAPSMYSGGCRRGASPDCCCGWGTDAELCVAEDSAIESFSVSPPSVPLSSWIDISSPSSDRSSARKTEQKKNQTRGQIRQNQCSPVKVLPDKPSSWSAAASE